MSDASGSRQQRSHGRRRGSTVLAGGIAAVLGVLAGCSSVEPPAGATSVLRIATVDNGDLVRLQNLSETFLEEHPGVSIEWVRQGENEIRQTISTDVGTGGGRFDVVTVGTYEAQIWGGRGLLAPLTGMPGGFDAADFIPTVREALTSDGELQAAPFYGESMFTMYRTDVFEQVGLEMPEDPTWDFIVDAASQISEETDLAGACVRGKPGWGENVALLTSMAHSQGARWFDENWVPQFDSEEWAQTTQDYLALAGAAPPGVGAYGYRENLDLFREGRCAIWVDATTAASFVTDPAESAVADTVGFVQAPTGSSGTPSPWLWAWSLAVPESSDNQDLAKEFVAWATSGEYAELVAAEYGWSNVPPGARRDLYDRPEYLQAAPFAELVLEAIERAEVDEPTTQPVPYSGLQYVAVPAFQSIGTAVGQQMTDAINDEITVEEALENSQWVSDTVIERTRLLDEQQTGTEGQP